ncbi:hypothetical protein [Philodulcilactobacillus myokoensis]|uniref:hypothetical protein n=1 Tax=Philodulcilactobacillus myokoensis TaxID=2929573 RepID=UPI0025710156|nr:hypothetical protein [Philodulcilactobacillus myokoensis]
MLKKWFDWSGVNDYVLAFVILLLLFMECMVIFANSSDNPSSDSYIITYLIIGFILHLKLLFSFNHLKVVIQFTVLLAILNVILVVGYFIYMYIL